MKDYAVYSDDKALYAVAVNRVLFKYARPNTRYQRSEIVPVGNPLPMKSHAEARTAADAWVGGTKH